MFCHGFGTGLWYVQVEVEVGPPCVAVPVCVQIFLWDVFGDTVLDLVPLLVCLFGG